MALDASPSTGTMENKQTHASWTFALAEVRREELSVASHFEVWLFVIALP